MACAQTRSSRSIPPFRLRHEGVHYLNSHAVFPTVTRANAAAMGTGDYPGTDGIH
jgi:predicted AlkP superfamily pyrophosphatase or phosphodiesterase